MIDYYGLESNTQHNLGLNDNGLGWDYHNLRILKLAYYAWLDFYI